MKTVIIEDERLAREELRALLEAHRDIEVVGEAANVKSGLELVGRVQPDLVFLDIQMPGMSGFDLLDALPEPRPLVIFTTAYTEYAVRAFEVNALDYLTKPIHPGRLASALARAQERLDAPDAAEEAGSGPQSGEVWGLEDRVFVREGDRCWFVPVKAIRLMESEGNYTRVHFDGASPLLHRTLASLEERLPAQAFLRANRAQLVNLSFVDSIEPWFSGSLKATLRGGGEIEFSRRQAQLFREMRSL